MAYDDRLIDKRVVDRNILKGLVEPSQLKRQIDSLPDSESNCVHVSLDSQGTDDVDLPEDDEDDLDDGDEDEEEEEASDEV